MKIAVTYEHGMIYQHFGHTEIFKVYEADDGKITKTEFLFSEGQGHGALAALLGANDIDAVICGCIGGGARAALAEAGIKLFGGVTGSADAAVEAFLSGNLDYNPDIMCSHHNGEHSCGSHSCGEHKCSGENN